MTADQDVPQPDYRLLFESLPGNYLVLAPDFRIVAASNACLHAIQAERERIVGRSVFEVFPEDPHDPSAGAARDLRDSLTRVLERKVANTMPVRKIDLRDPQTGASAERYWLTVNAPVLDARGEVVYLVHCTEDVTASVLQDGAEKPRNDRLLHDNRFFLDSIVDNLPLMLFVKDARDLRFRLVNRTGERLLGFARTQLIDKSDFDFFPKEQAEFFVAKDRDVLRSGEMLDIPEEPIRTRSGDVRILHTKKIPIRDLSGTPIYLLGISEDITEKKAAEEDIRRLNTELAQHVCELETVNRELESFSYSVSHDLRAPLRSIDGFSRILMDDYGDKLDAQALDSLGRIRAATQRMGRLIDDLLLLSRVVRDPMKVRPVNLSTLAEEIVEDLRHAEPTRSVRVDIQPDLVARGDARLLRVLLDNLLSNAWKFTGTTADAHIEVGAERSGDAAQVYFVRDNGVGFDETHVDKLFTPFQRLHAMDEFPGTGVGLAIVQRVVRRHGGKVWARGKVNQGATISFTL